MSTTVVCDCGPLIALGGIDHLGLLRELFSRTLVPQAVADELLANGDAAVGVGAFKQARWLQVSPLETPCDALLANLVDAGEASVITMARQIPGAVVLMDEAKGRKVARDIYGLSVIGTGRVLVEAKARGLVSRVGPLLQVIRANGYWMSDAIRAAILRQAGE
jgi:predicted nucleic acid-binding protein